MTTPNGDWVPNRNPDHKRHYTRSGLQALLATHFADVAVEYAIAEGTFRTLGLRPWSLARPWFSAVGMAANVVNALQSASPVVRQRAQRTRHLIATAWKATSCSRAH
jgi:hypothetical protein